MTPADWLGQAVGPVRETLGLVRKGSPRQEFGPCNKNVIDCLFVTVGQTCQRDFVTLIRLSREKWTGWCTGLGKTPMKLLLRFGYLGQVSDRWVVETCRLHVRAWFGFIYIHICVCVCVYFQDWSPCVL